MIKEINLRHKVAEVLKSKTWSTAFVAYPNILYLSFALIQKGTIRQTQMRRTLFLSRTRGLLQNRPKRIEILNIKKYHKICFLLFV